MKIVPYVSYNGNCEEAVKFYNSILGGELIMMRFGELPPSEEMSMSSEWQEKIMHAAITFEDGNAIYFSDTWEGQELVVGTNFNLHINLRSEKEVFETFEKLSEGGTVTMPVEKTFWGSVYGSLVDKFGVGWGLEFELVKA